MLVEGSVYTDMPGEIGGTVNGDFFATGHFVILKTGVVSGDIHAADMEVCGTVNGNITCSRKLVLKPACIVKGNIAAAEITAAENIDVAGIITTISEMEVAEDERNMGIETATSYLKNDNTEKAIEIAKPVVEDEENETWF